MKRSKTNRPLFHRHHSRSRHARLTGEALESRTLLAAEPIITEFMASNQATLRDNDRESSDWIEIYNAGDAAAQLAGWHLTDDSGNLTKWTFPDVSLNPEQYLVVFASGKDRQDTDGELHTNFRLSAGADYLALVQPDGQTIVSQFAPAYPQQFTDVSYGFRMVDAERKFVQVGSAAQIWVPTDNSLGTTWTSPDYVPDGRWVTEKSPGTPVTVGIGYETNSGFAADIQTDVGSLMKDKNPGIYVRVPFQLDSLDGIKELNYRIKFDDGYLLYLNGSILDVQNGPFFGTYNSTATATQANDAAVVFEEIDLTQYLDRLRVGQNVLAIHALNITASDNDFLLVPELYTSGLTILQDASGYFTSPTPGALNPSEFALGPSIIDATHTPSQPGPGDALTVTATVRQTLHPLQDVALVYRVMYGDEVTLAMVDNGQGADATAGDGVFTAIIPADVAQPGQMLRYYVTATDSTNEPSRLPRVLDTTGTDRSPEYFGTVVLDATLSDNLPIFEWFTESVSRARGRSGARASVYYLGEFYDNIFVRQRGGATNGASQKFNFDDDQKFFVNDELGRVAEINMNAQGSDPSFLRQSLSFEAFSWAGNETSESFLMQMRVNGGADRIGVFIEQVDEDFLERNGLDPEGALYKFVQRSNLDPVFADTTTGIEKKTRLDEGLEDVRVVVDGLTKPTAPERAFSVFDNFNVAQVLNYVAIRSVNLDADDVRKNFYLYRDTNGTGQWSIFPWDKDWVYGVEGDGAPWLHHPYFGDQAHAKSNANQWNRLYDAIFTDPVLSQMYLRRLRTVMDELLQPPGTPADQGRFELRVDEMLAEAGDLLSRAAISNAQGSLKNYFPLRRNELYLDHSIDNLTQGEIRDIISEYATGVQYFVPTDDALGTSWTGLSDPANIAQWSVGQTGFGFNDRFAELIRTTVNPADSCADCTSIYLRIPFQITDAAAIDALTLRMKYDDGFIAYLNGTEVARANVNGAPAYNVRASSHSNTAAVEFENFNISANANLLRNGQNILAIHAVNSSATSNDQLLMPALVEGIIGTPGAVGIPHAQVGNPPLAFGDFDYNPASGNQDEEYIELRNPLDTAVDISGWQLTGGIEHTFLSGTIIPANGSMYVSPSVPAFLARTSGPHGGEGRFVQGNYLGHLSNFGETVQLVAADGTLMATLTTPVTPSDAQRYLRMSEVHYNPAGSEEATEFVELTNISSGANATTLNLSGVTLSGGPAESFVFAAGASLAPGQYLVIAKDPVALAAAYPQLAANQIHGPYVGSLSNAGELLRLDDAQGSTILEFSYDDNELWPQRADGDGASLEVIDVAGTPVQLLDKPYSWRGSVELGGSPGRAGAAPLGVRINEVLANSEAPGAVDSIELVNVSGQPINLGGWYLSDSSDNFLKYRIAAGTTLNPGQYLVFTQNQFGSAQAAVPFALNGDRGDEVFLVTTDPAGGQPNRFVDDVHFGASAADEAWGRVPDGQGILAPLQATSFGAPNGAPRVGPVIISEINYHPAQPSSAARAVYTALDSNDLEFVEIHNPTPAAVDLSAWRLRGGVDFDFRPGTVLQPGQTLVVVPFNPAGQGNGSRTQAFRVHYGLDDQVLMVGGYQGQLSDSHDRIELQRPGIPSPDDPAFVPLLTEDEVRYDDRAPWPTDADGGGATLTRAAATAYGNSASSWLSASPSPGQAIFVNADLNNDGVVNSADIDHLCQGLRGGDPRFDLNGDAVLDEQDLQFFVQGVLRTSIGDANLDGVFNSSDLVEVLAAGEYEDGVANNSGWAEGDWNCDGEFNTKDILAAFQAGGYVSAAEPAARPVLAPALELVSADVAAALLADQVDDRLSR